jgi:hypothetical protein
MIVDGFVCTSSYKTDFPPSDPANGTRALSKSALLGVDCTLERDGRVRCSGCEAAPKPSSCRGKHAKLHHQSEHIHWNLLF